MTTNPKIVASELFEHIADNIGLRIIISDQESLRSFAGIIDSVERDAAADKLTITIYIGSGNALAGTVFRYVGLTIDHPTGPKTCGVLLMQQRNHCNGVTSTIKRLTSSDQHADTLTGTPSTTASPTGCSIHYKA